MEKYEFLSPEWIAYFRKVIRDGLAGEDLTGIDYSTYQVYRNVPRHLRRGASHDIAIGVRIRNGRVEFTDSVIPGATSGVTMEYNYLAPRIHLTHAELQKETGIEPMAYFAKQVANGNIKLEGDMRVRPTCWAKISLHDRMSERTKPHAST